LTDLEETEAEVAWRALFGSSRWTKIGESPAWRVSTGVVCCCNPDSNNYTGLSLNVIIFGRPYLSNGGAIWHGCCPSVRQSRMYCG